MARAFDALWHQEHLPRPCNLLALDAVAPYSTSTQVLRLALVPNVHSGDFKIQSVLDKEPHPSKPDPINFKA